MKGRLTTFFIDKEEKLRFPIKGRKKKSQALDRGFFSMQRAVNILLP
jgi:hypothetical protein